MNCKDCGNPIPPDSKFGLCALCGIARLAKVMNTKPKKNKKLRPGAKR